MRKLPILIAVILEFTSGAELEIRVYNTARVSASNLQRAALVVDGLLRRAKIAATWIEVDPPAAATLPRLACRAQRSITLRLLQSEPRELPSAALGYATLSATSDDVTILIRRVMELGRVQEVEPGTLLGYVMAHEIVHVLLQRRTHGTMGLMADKWRAREFSLMRNYSLRFDVRDSARMRAALDGRACENR